MEATRPRMADKMATWATGGSLWGLFGVSLGLLWACWGSLGGVLGLFGRIPGRSWGHLGRFWR